MASLLHFYQFFLACFVIACFSADIEFHVQLDWKKLKSVHCHFSLNSPFCQLLVLCLLVLVRAGLVRGSAFFRMGPTIINLIFFALHMFLLLR
jgi:hypothetical protein